MLPIPTQWPTTFFWLPSAFPRSYMNVMVVVKAIIMRFNTTYFDKTMIITSFAISTNFNAKVVSSIRMMLKGHYLSEFVVQIR